MTFLDIWKSRQSIAAVAIAAMLACAAGPVRAHGIGHTIIDRPLAHGAVAVEFRLSDGSAMANASVRVIAPADNQPVVENGRVFLAGRTDRLGRIAFVPDRPGAWQVQVEDGLEHVAVTTLHVTEDGAVPAQSAWRQWLLRGSLLFNLALIGLLCHLLVARRGGGRPVLGSDLHHSGGSVQPRAHATLNGAASGGGLSDDHRHFPSASPSKLVVAAKARTQPR